jgi:hypothetical protein
MAVRLPVGVSEQGTLTGYNGAVSRRVTLVMTARHDIVAFASPHRHDIVTSASRRAGHGPWDHCLFG